MSRFSNPAGPEAQTNRGGTVSRGRRPFYLFLVVGLATLVGGIIAAGNLRPTYTAKVRVEIRQDGSTSALLQRFENDLREESHVERTVYEGLGSVREMVFADEVDALTTVREAARRIQVTHRSGNARDGLVADVELSDAEPWKTAGIINALVRQLLVEQSAGEELLAAHDLDAAAAATSKAQHQVQDVQLRLDTELSRLSAIPSPELAPQDDRSNRAKPPSTTPEHADADPYSAQRKALSAELKRLRDERYRQLERLTEKHPSIQNLDAQMDRIESELVTLPPPTEAPTFSEEPTNEPEPPFTEVVEAHRRREAQLEKVEASRKALRIAMDELRECERRESEYRDANATAVPAKLEVLEWADGDVRPNEPVREWGNVFAFATAVCFAVGVTVTARGLPQPLRSLGELRNLIDLPVVATISPTGAPPEDRRYADPRIAARRRVVDLAWRGSELLLASVVAVIGILVATVPSFAGLIRSDPLRALSTITDHLMRSLPI